MTDSPFWPDTAVKKHSPVFPFKVACARRHSILLSLRTWQPRCFFLWIICAACNHVTQRLLRTEWDCLLRYVSKILQQVLFFRKHLFSRCRPTDELWRSLFWVIKVWMCSCHFWSSLSLTKTHQYYAYSLRFFPSRKDAWDCLEKMRSSCRCRNACLSC